MKELVKKKWSYVLYEDGGDYILSVMSGGVGLYEIKVYLSSEEKDKCLKDEPYLEHMVSLAKTSSDYFKGRYLK
ncbi:MAG: hypothetical protein JKY67_10500 [Pseudomonadales bacterium]|nr:hypothetical protein [Pseudomonadales bacterium]